MFTTRNLRLYGYHFGKLYTPSTLPCSVGKKHLNSKIIKCTHPVFTTFPKRKIIDLCLIKILGTPCSNVMAVDSVLQYCEAYSFPFSRVKF